MATRGENWWPSLGNFSDRLRGESHGRRQPRIGLTATPSWLIRNCFADATGEALGVLLRPGNAGADNIADHVTVLDQAIAASPAEIAAGHRLGDDPSLVRHPPRRTPAATATPPLDSPSSALATTAPPSDSGPNKTPSPAA